MGALVTLQLPSDSPIRELPWIITFGPLTEDEDWEPVVCGPYERPHALALAEEVVADEELMAVVEPLLGYAAPDEIRDEIGAARAATSAGDVAGSVDEDGLGDEGPDDEGLDEDAAVADGAALGVPVLERGLADGLAPADGVTLPTPAEVRAGMARVVRQLAD